MGVFGVEIQYRFVWSELVFAWRSEGQHRRFCALPARRGSSPQLDLVDHVEQALAAHVPSRLNRGPWGYGRPQAQTRPHAIFRDVGTDAGAGG